MHFSEQAVPKLLLMRLRYLANQREAKAGGSQIAQRIITRLVLFSLGSSPSPSSLPVLMAFWLTSIS